MTLHGGGPAHINLETVYSRDLSVTCLPPVKVVKRISYDDELPTLPQGRIAIFIGSHRAFTEDVTMSIDRFCETTMQSFFVIIQVVIKGVFDSWMHCFP